MAEQPLHLVIVPHTHWDREWYRTHEQFRSRLVRLVDRLLDLLESRPGFRHFTLDGQSVILDDYLELRPGARERIEKLVAAGRLMVGPWYVLPDEWLVSGEALVRNLRLGLRRADAAGGAMRLGYVPDQFGHVGQLPQIFAGFGFESAVLWRGVGENVRETLFRWRAPDGTSLLTVYLSRGYSHAGHLPGDPRVLRERLEREVLSLARRSRIPSILLMNGADHAEPTPDLVERLERALAGRDGWSFEIGTLPGFVARARAEAPDDLVEHEGELRSGLRAPLLPGCASARASQKRRDFENDRLLTRYLEPLATWLANLGGDPDCDVLEHLWRTALENHPHDSICGCSIDAVHEQMEARFARVAELGSEQLERVVGALAERSASASPHHDDEHLPEILVWNPGARGAAPVEVEVELDVEPDAAEAAPVHVQDAAGRPLATECEALEAGESVMTLTLPATGASAFLAMEMPDFLGYEVQDLSWRDTPHELEVRIHVGRSTLLRRPEVWQRKLGEVRERLSREPTARVHLELVRRPRWRLRFVDELPGCGLRRYALAPGAGPRTRELSREKLADEGRAVENEHWRVEVSAAGRVSLIRRRDGLRIDDALRIVSEGDRGDEYNFDPVPDGAVVDSFESVAVRYGSRSPVRVGIRLRGRYRVPEALDAGRLSRSESSVTLSVEVSLALWSGIDRIDAAVVVDNRARDHRLRVLLGAPLAANRFEVESAFEIARRPIELPPPGERPPAEHPIGATPQRSFATAADGRLGMTVANRGIAEVEALAGDGVPSRIALTLIRAVGWLSRDDLALRPMHAGPPFATPGAQVPGVHRAELSLRVHADGDPDRASEAHRFVHPPLARAVAAARDDGSSLRDGARLVEVDDPEVVISAVEPRADGGSVLRLWNATSVARRVRIVWRGRGALETVDLSEQPCDSPRLEADGAAVHLELGPCQIATLAAR